MKTTRTATAPNGHTITISTWDVTRNGKTKTMGDADCAECGERLNYNTALPATLNRKVREHGKDESPVATKATPARVTTTSTAASDALTPAAGSVLDILSRPIGADVAVERVSRMLAPLIAE